MAGFAFGHLRMPGHRAGFLVFLLGLTLPFEGIITPLYYQVRDIGLLNTRWAIILPLIGLFMPFSVLWMRAHFVNVPDDVSEAARIDGANTWQLFWRIHVPLATPAISSLGDPAVPLDVEPVPARDRVGRRSGQAHDGRCAGRLPGPVGDRHPVVVRRLAADPRADPDRLRRSSSVASSPRCYRARSRDRAELHPPARPGRAEEAQEQKAVSSRAETLCRVGFGATTRSKGVTGDG